MRRVTVGLAALAAWLAGCAMDNAKGSAATSQPAGVPAAVSFGEGAWDLPEMETAPLNVEIVSREEKQVGGVAIVKCELFYDSLASDGKPVRIYGWYGYPASAGKDKPVPAVIWSHGGGGRVAPNEIDTFVPKGFAFLTIDLPGKGDGRAQSHSTGLDMNSANLNYLPASPTDLQRNYIYQSAVAMMRGVTFLRQRPEVDVRRIGAIGWSWGGLIVSVMNAHDPRLRAVVAGVPVTDVMTTRGPQMSDEDWRKARLYREQFDPFVLAPRMLHPTLVLAGSNDAPEGRALYADRLTVPHRLYIVPNGGHGSGQGELWSRYTWYDQFFRWFDWQMNAGPPMPEVDKVAVARVGRTVEVTLSARPGEHAVVEAEVWYRVLAAARAGEAPPLWQRVKAEKGRDGFRAVVPEGRAIVLYVLIRDDRGAMVTSRVLRAE